MLHGGGTRAYWAPKDCMQLVGNPSMTLKGETNPNVQIAHLFPVIRPYLLRPSHRQL